MASSYSPYLNVLYDQQEPVGDFGRGTHYSVFRALSWHGPNLRPLRRSKLQDFAVIWDEDHDCRVMHAIQQIYFAGLLSPIQFIGERKAFVSVIISPESARALGPAGIQKLSDELEHLIDPFDGDVFELQLSVRGDSDPMIVNAGGDQIEIFFQSIDLLWKLGLKDLTAERRLADS